MRKHASTWLCSLLINKWNWILFTFLFFWIPEDWKFLCWNFGWATWWIRTFQGWTICQRKQPQVTTLWKSLQQNWLFQNWVKSVMRRRTHWWTPDIIDLLHKSLLNAQPQGMQRTISHFPHTGRDNHWWLLAKKCCMAKQEMLGDCDSSNCATMCY